MLTKLKNKTLVLLISSLFMGNSFVFSQQTSTVSDAVIGGSVNSPSPRRLSIDHNVSTLSPSLNPYNISIPEQFGQIEEVFQGETNSPLVVHIQNVHANYEAQVNIKNILNHLVNQYQFSLIQLEGAVSKLDPAILQPSYLKEANLKLVDFLMREGRITGADAFAVETEKPVELYGMEDYSLYMENLKMFKTIYKHQEDLKPYFDEVHRLILAVGPKLLNPELLDFTRKTEEFSTDKIDILDYLVYMNKLSEKHKLISLNELSEMVNYPNLTRLIRLKNLEDQPNKAGLKKETDAIKLEFQKKMPGSAKAKELLSHLDGSAKGVNPRTYFLELTKLADEAKVDFVAYPAFRIFAEFLIHQDEIDHRALFSELKQFEKMLQEKLFMQDDEKLFLSLIDYIGLLEQFFRLEMSREKIALYVKDRDMVKPSWIFEHLDELAKKENIVSKPAGDLQKLDSYMDEVEYYYQLVLKRDEVFADKILTKAKTLSQDKTIIVSGGFHKDGLIDHFRKEKISYVVINPKVDVKEGNQNYLKVMLQEDAVAGSVFAGTFAMEVASYGNPNSGLRIAREVFAPGELIAQRVAGENFDVTRANNKLHDVAVPSGVVFEIKSVGAGFTASHKASAQFFNDRAEARQVQFKDEVDRSNGTFQVRIVSEVPTSKTGLERFGVVKPKLSVPFKPNSLPTLVSVKLFQPIRLLISPAATVLDEFPLHVFVPGVFQRDQSLVRKLTALTPLQAERVYASLIRGSSMPTALEDSSESGIPFVAANNIQELSVDQDRKNRLRFFDSVTNPAKPSVLLLATSENTAMSQLWTLANDVKENGTAAVVYGKGVSELVDAMNLRSDLRKKIKTIDVSEALSENEIFGMMFKDLTVSRYTYSMYRQYVAPYTNEPMVTAAKFLENGYVRILVPEENPSISPKHPLLPTEIGFREAVAQLFPNVPQLASAIRRQEIMQNKISNAVAAIEVEVLRRIPRNNPQEFEEFQTLLRKYSLSNIIVGQGVQWGFATGVEALLGQISQDMKAAVRAAIAA